ncbi:MAG: hypothetical protein ABUK01_08985 [Leptospirales bacterium]
MSILLYTVIIIFFLLMGYSFAKKYIFVKDQLMHTSGSIEKISIVRIGEMWSPELFIDYTFYHEGAKYEGSDYFRIDRFIGIENIYLSDRNGFPVLVTPNEDFIGEEYIETFLLEYRQGAPVEFNIASLPHSRLYSEERQKDTMFENVEIDFPWTR